MTELLETNRLAGVDASTEAQASSAHSRINIPINLSNWKKLDPEITGQLLWFHQHCLDQGLGLKEAAEAVQYSDNAVYKVLKGIYEGSYKEFVAGIRSYRTLLAKRESIQNSEFVHTRNTKLIFNALDYAMAANSITLILGESGMSKTASCEQWQKENNHGQTVLVDAAEIGGAKGLMMEICTKIGANKNQSILQMRNSIHRAFNRNRMLIVDEASFLLPSDRRSFPVALEFLRHLHDKTKCALAITATARFRQDLEQNNYQFEQLLGRIGMPVRLFPSMEAEDLKPLLEQYFDNVTETVMETAVAIANDQLPEYKGRLRVLVELLRFASKIAKKDKSRVTEKHFLKVMATRKAMMGATHVAHK